MTALVHQRGVVSVHASAQENSAPVCMRAFRGTSISENCSDSSAMQDPGIDVVTPRLQVCGNLGLHIHHLYLPQVS